MMITNRWTKKFGFATGAVIALLFFFSAESYGQLISPISVSTSGTFNNSNALIHDGVFPLEGSVWTGATNMWWQGQAGTTGVVSVFDLGTVYNIADSEMSFDNNDTYVVDYSLDGSSWSNLFTVLSTYGEIGAGMDTFSTFAASSEYISQIDFSTTQAQYLRVYAVGGDSLYSIGEFQAFGSAIPEPGATCILGALVISWMVPRRRT